MTSDEFTILPFDVEKHGAFVFDSFRKSLTDCWPWSHIPPRALLDDLRRQMALGRTVIAADPTDPDNLLAWAVTRPEVNEVVMAYTKHAYRQKFGIGVGLVTAAGVDLTRATGVRYWTRASERIGHKPGWHLYHRVTEDI